MKLKPLISFIIPVYNGERYIDKCIESILNQTVKNFEIIIIDDGSKDNTFNKCKYYQSKYNNIKVFTQENQGVSIARNNGLKNSSGEWIIFVDSDDEVVEDYIECVLKYLDNESDLILFEYGVDKKNNKDISNKIYTETYIEDKKNDLIICALDNKRMSEKWRNISLRAPWAKVYKKSLLKNYNIKFTPKIKMGEDLLFNINVYLNANKVKYIKKIVYIVDERNDSVSRDYIDNLDEIDKLFYDNLYKILDKYNLSNDIWTLYYKESFVGIMRCMKYQYFNSKCKLSYSEVKKRLNNMIVSEPYIKAIDITKKNSSFNKKIIAWLLYFRLFYILKVIYTIKIIF